MIIHVLVTIYAAILFVSSVFAGVLWYAYRNPLLRLLFFLWLTAIAGFFGQGAFNNLELSGFLAFSINGASVFFLVLIFARASGTQMRWRLFAAMMASGFLGSLVLNFLPLPFAARAFPFISACAAILVMAALKGVTFSKAQILNNSYRVLLLANACHFLDYPWVRPREDLAVWGFSITLTFFFAYAIFIPLFLMKTISDRYTEQLEGAVQKRTTELSQANLRLLELNQSLESKNHALDELATENRSLLSILIHDISNPLQIIYGFFENDAVSKSIPEDKFPVVRRSRSALQSISEIMSQVRRLHLVKVGKSVVELDKFMLKDAVDEVVELLTEQLNSKELMLDIIYECDPDVHVYGDKTGLKNQVLANLLTNAIKFSHPNATIEVTIHVVDDNVRISVRDFGMGVPDETRAKIFAMDQVTTSVGTRGERGSGLGLPIAKQTTQLMGGDIRLAQLPSGEHGSCFEVDLKKAS